jgi:hypothetical protein
MLRQLASQQALHTTHLEPPTTLSRGWFSDKNRVSPAITPVSNPRPAAPCHSHAAPNPASDIQPSAAASAAAVPGVSGAVLCRPLKYTLCRVSRNPSWPCSHCRALNPGWHGLPSKTPPGGPPRDNGTSKRRTPLLVLAGSDADRSAAAEHSATCGCSRWIQQQRSNPWSSARFTNSAATWSVCFLVCFTRTSSNTLHVSKSLLP